MVAEFVLFADAPQLSLWDSAVGGAIIAALGYVGKQVADFGLEVWRERKAQRARLIELRSLLRAANATFRAQQRLARRLYKSLTQGNADHGLFEGYERLFAKSFPTFTPEQKELHLIIRGMTEHSMRPLNAAMADWLRMDTAFKVARWWPGRSWARLARELSDLEAHLALWLANFQAWIPGQENHALVYLAGKQKYGVGFPKRIDELVEELVTGKVIKAKTSAAKAST